MEAFALITMAIYLGFIYILLLLVIGAVFSRTCLYLLLGEALGAGQQSGELHGL